MNTINENERGNSFARGLFFYMDQSYFVYNCKMGSFRYPTNTISAWKSAGIFNYFDNSNMNAVGDTSRNLPDLKNDGRMNVYLSGNYFKQDRTCIPNNNNAINICCVYKLDLLDLSRDATFTIKMLYLELCKLLNMLILQNMTIKDMVYVLMKEISLVIQ